MNISVPEEMFAYIQERGQSYRYCSVSEYIRSLVRDDQFREEKKANQPSLEPRRASECVDMVRDEMKGKGTRANNGRSY
jgi:Arc/MetJ-type ribon-helix-helix transcriptional regulator